MLLAMLTGCWVGAWALIVGGASSFDSQQDSEWEPCAYVQSVEPLDGAIGVGLEPALALELDREPSNLQMGLVGVDTEIVQQGSVASLTLMEPLEPESFYTWWVDTGCQYREFGFTTGAYGQPLEISAVALAQRSYGLRLYQESKAVAPSALQSTLSDVFGGWIGSRVSVREDGSLEMAQIVQGAQDMCQRTHRLLGALNWQDGQGVWSGTQVPWRSDYGLVEFEELSVQGVLAPDGSSMGYVTIAGLMGTSTLNAHFQDDFCTVAELSGVQCEPCQDPSGCLRVRMEELIGVGSELAVEPVELERCHSECAENSQDCVLDTGI